MVNISYIPNEEYSNQKYHDLRNILMDAFWVLTDWKYKFAQSWGCLWEKEYGYVEIH